MNRVVILSPSSPFSELVSVSHAGPGRILVSWTIRGGRDSLRTYDSTRSSARARNSVPVQLAIYDWNRPGEVEVVAELMCPLLFPDFLLLQSRHIAIISSLCDYSSAGPEINAYVVDGEGSVCAQGSIGYDMCHAAVLEGRIVVAYGDMGLHSEYAVEFLATSGEDPIAFHGIAEFDEQLELIWKYPNFSKSFPVLSSIQSINAGSSDAWILAHSEPSALLIKISNGEIEQFSCDVVGSRALLVDGQGLAAIGGFEGFRDRIVYLEIAADRRVAHESSVLPSGLGQMISETPFVVGAGEMLDIVSLKHEWIHLSLSELRELNNQ